MDFSLTDEFLLYQIDMLQHTDIDRSDFARVVAAQKIIHIVERRQVILPVFVAIDDFQAFIGPHIHQRQPALGKLTSLHRLWTSEPSTQ